MLIRTVIDKMIYNHIRDGSISSAIRSALLSYLDYIEHASPEDVLKEVTLMLKLVPSRREQIANITISRNLLERLLRLKNKYNIRRACIINRALQYYLEKERNIKIELATRKTLRKSKRCQGSTETYYCYEVAISRETYEKLMKRFRRKFKYIVKEYIAFFETLSPEEKLREISLINVVKDPRARARGSLVLAMYSRTRTDFIDEFTEKYGIPRKRLILRAVEWAAQSVKAPISL